MSKSNSSIDSTEDEASELLKLDVEGAELEGVPARQQLLQARRITNILLEINEAALCRGGSSSAELMALVKSYGYRMWRIGRFHCQPFNLTAPLGHNINVLAAL